MLVSNIQIVLLSVLVQGNSASEEAVIPNLFTLDLCFRIFSQGLDLLAVELDADITVCLLYTSDAADE